MIPNSPYQAVRIRRFMHLWVHVTLTWVMLWLSYVFLDGEATFQTSHSFDLMAEIMTEQEWGILTGVIALIGATVTFVNNWCIRTFSAGLLGFAHFVIAVEFYRGNPHGTGAGPYIGYAVLGAALAYSTAHLGARLERGVEPSDPP